MDARCCRCRLRKSLSRILAVAHTPIDHAGKELASRRVGGVERPFRVERGIGGIMGRFRILRFLATLIVWRHIKILCRPLERWLLSALQALAEFGGSIKFAGYIVLGCEDLREIKVVGRLE
jgi:hypothetical protein